MKFILPNGEKSSELTPDFIGETLKISYSDAVYKKNEFNGILTDLAYTNDFWVGRTQFYSPSLQDISLHCLATVIVNNDEKYGTPVYSSYDNAQENNAMYRAQDKIIRDLEFLLYKSFPDYFKNVVHPLTQLLSVYFGVSIEYEFGAYNEKSGTPLIVNDELKHLRLSFEIKGEEVWTPNDEKCRSVSDSISAKLDELGVYSFVEISSHARHFPNMLTIPWFYVPLLNESLRKLNIEIPPEKVSSIFPYSFSLFPESSIFTPATEKKASPTEKVSGTFPYSFALFPESNITPATEKEASPNYAEIMDLFESLGFFKDIKDKITISDLLNIVGKTVLEFAKEIPREEIKQIAVELNKIGLECKPIFIIDLYSSIKINLKVKELEIWLRAKVSPAGMSLSK